MSYSVDTYRSSVNPGCTFLSQFDISRADKRIEEDGTLPAVANEFNLMYLLTTPRANGQSIVPKKLRRKTQMRTRFSFIENRYGMKSQEPRKVTKSTFVRLANPILGKTSTLNALPPEIRKKREKELNSVAMNSCTESSKKTRLQKPFKTIEVKSTGNCLQKVKPTKDVKAKKTVAAKKMKNVTSNQETDCSSSTFFLTQVADDNNDVRSTKGNKRSVELVMVVLVKLMDQPSCIMLV
jgi:hypothetical protein